MIEPNPWFTVYFALGLECSIPVLEALHYNAWLAPFNWETFKRFKAKVFAIVGRRHTGKTWLARAIGKKSCIVDGVTAKDIYNVSQLSLYNKTVIFDDIGRLELLRADVYPLLNNIRQTREAKLIFVFDSFQDIPGTLRHQIDCFIFGSLLNRQERSRACQQIDYPTERYPDLDLFQWVVAPVQIPRKFWILDGKDIDGHKQEFYF